MLLTQRHIRQQGCDNGRAFSIQGAKPSHTHMHLGTQIEKQKQQAQHLFIQQVSAKGTFCMSLRISLIADLCDCLQHHHAMNA